MVTPLQLYTLIANVSHRTWDVTFPFGCRFRWWSPGLRHGIDWWEGSCVRRNKPCLSSRQKQFRKNIPTTSLLPGAELSLIADSFALLNDLFLPFLSILDASCPISDLHMANVLFDVILPSVLGYSLWSFGQGFPIKYLLNCSGIWHSLHVTKPA